MSRLLYSDDEFTLIIKSSLSIADVLRAMNLVPEGANYRMARKRIAKLNLDTSHFVGQSWNKGLTHDSKIPIEDYLSNSKAISSHCLRLRLIKDGIKKHECEECQLTMWNGKPIPLELHHIDGDHYNNKLINIAIICPNCHAQTKNHAGKAKKKPKSISLPLITEKRRYKPRVRVRTNVCACGREKNKKSLVCEHCYQSTKKTKINWPNKEELTKLVWSKPLSLLSKDLGVSDNAIRKWVKKHDIELPQMGHWLKK